MSSLVQWITKLILSLARGFEVLEWAEAFVNPEIRELVVMQITGGFTADRVSDISFTSRLDQWVSSQHHTVNHRHSRTARSRAGSVYATDPLAAVSVAAGRRGLTKAPNYCSQPFYYY